MQDKNTRQYQSKLKRSQDQQDLLDVMEGLTLATPALHYVPTDSAAARQGDADGYIASDVHLHQDRDLIPGAPQTGREGHQMEPGSFQAPEKSARDAAASHFSKPSKQVAAEQMLPVKWQGEFPATATSVAIPRASQPSDAPPESLEPAQSLQHQNFRITRIAGARSISAVQDTAALDLSNVGSGISPGSSSSGQGASQHHLMESLLLGGLSDSAACSIPWRTKRKAVCLEPAQSCIPHAQVRALAEKCTAAPLPDNWETGGLIGRSVGFMLLEDFDAGGQTISCGIKTGRVLEHVSDGHLEDVCSSATCTLQHSFHFVRLSKSEVTQQAGSSYSLKSVEPPDFADADEGCTHGSAPRQQPSSCAAHRNLDINL
ncbi:hypothetical protein WJX75_000812 [Coccomyxa subellipsoidea]|uniref:Uncharacterized protein n=1 Tax=Coccomyxa subellipsoidea TaxID=248742 RepID=A0ABR2YBD3_9CHLO